MPLAPEPVRRWRRCLTFRGGTCLAVRGTPDRTAQFRAGQSCSLGDLRSRDGGETDRPSGGTRNSLRHPPLHHHPLRRL